MQKYSTTQVAEWFRAWKRSRRPLGQFSPPGAPGARTLARLFNEYHPDEYKAYIATRRKRAPKVGTNFEVRCKNILEENGWFAIRSPKSRGPADIVAIKRERFPWFIQCKTDPKRLTPGERRAVLDLAFTFGGVPVLAYKGPKTEGVKWLRLDNDEEWTLDGAPKV